MVSYGSNAEVQRLAYGAVNSSLDAKTTSFRDVATSKVNAFLDLHNDIETPSDLVTRCTNLLAAAMIRTPTGDPTEDSFWKMAEQLLEQLKGDETTDAPWRLTIVGERFHGRGSEHDHPLNFVDN